MCCRDVASRSLGGPPLASQLLPVRHIAVVFGGRLWLALLRHFECSSVAGLKFDDTSEVAALWVEGAWS
jgi:hypothetical protein